MTRGLSRDGNQNDKVLSLQKLQRRPWLVRSFVQKRTCSVSDIENSLPIKFQRAIRNFLSLGTNEPLLEFFRRGEEGTVHFGNVNVRSHDLARGADPSRSVKPRAGHVERSDAAINVPQEPVLHRAGSVD